MSKTHPTETIAKLVHEKSLEILTEVGFCVPDDSVLARLDSAGFLVNHESQMVRITPQLLDVALQSLPQDVRLYSRDGEILTQFGAESCFMGAGTPVNVFDLQSGKKRSSMRQDVRHPG
jgi:trimethylamine:corrinoid methyltransferase-like protein